MMCRRTVEGNVQPPQLAERQVFPMVGVCVRQKNGVHAIPGRADGRETCAEKSWPEANIDEQPEPVRLQKGAVARTAARQDTKPRGHAALRRDEDTQPIRT